LDDHFGWKIAVFESAEAVVRGCPQLVDGGSSESNLTFQFGVVQGKKAKRSDLDVSYLAT